MRTVIVSLALAVVASVCDAQWYQQNSGSTTFLEGVHFVNGNMGWVVGGSGTILHTNDAGATWISQTSGITNWLFDVQFTDVNTGWVVGDYGTILHTTDGGVTWLSQTAGQRIGYFVSISQMRIPDGPSDVRVLLGKQYFTQLTVARCG